MIKKTPEISRKELPYCFQGKMIGVSCCERQGCTMHCGLRQRIFLLD